MGGWLQRCRLENVCQGDVIHLQLYISHFFKVHRGIVDARQPKTQYLKETWITYGVFLFSQHKLCASTSSSSRFVWESTTWTPCGPCHVWLYGGLQSCQEQLLAYMLASSVDSFNVLYLLPVHNLKYFLNFVDDLSLFVLSLKLKMLLFVPCSTSHLHDVRFHSSFTSRSWLRSTIRERRRPERYWSCARAAGDFYIDSLWYSRWNVDGDISLREPLCPVEPELAWCQ